MASEWAKQRAAEFFATDMPSDREYLLALATNLDAARGQGRREGLEEAATIALTEATQLDGLNERMAKGADRVAIAIRARINQEGK